jgi:hypothetical protein
MPRRRSVAAGWRCGCAALVPLPVQRLAAPAQVNAATVPNERLLFAPIPRMNTDASQFSSDEMQRCSGRDLHHATAFFYLLLAAIDAPASLPAPSRTVQRYEKTQEISNMESSM